MSNKLIDLNCLSTYNEKVKAAIKVEKDRAEAAEEGLNNKIEAKTNAYVLSYADTSVDTSQYANYCDSDGNYFTSAAALTEYIKNKTCWNNQFRSQLKFTISPLAYIITRNGNSSTYSQLYKILLANSISKQIKTGDDFYVIEEDVPDWWIDIGGISGIATAYPYNAKADLTAYQTRTDYSLQTTDHTIVGAINEINGVNNKIIPQADFDILFE